MMPLEHKLRVGELALRVAVLGLGLIAALLIGTDSEVRTFFAVEKKAKFTDMKVLVFLVVANGVVAGYSFLQGLFCLMRVAKGSVVLNRGLASVIFVCDQVMAYLTLSAAAAAAQSGLLGLFGQPELQWMKLCNLCRKFCTRGGEGLAFAFIASVLMISLSCISSFNLFRLCGSSSRGKDCNGTH